MSMSETQHKKTQGFMWKPLSEKNHGEEELHNNSQIQELQEGVRQSLRAGLV